MQQKVKYSSPILDYECWDGADPGFLAVSPKVTLAINPVVGRGYFPSQSDHRLGWYQIILLVKSTHL